MKRKGITLIEILVALAILGMIALALYGILKGGLDVWRGGKERTDIIAQARVAMDRMTRELREADVPTGETTNIIHDMFPRAYIQFSADIEDDGTYEMITYSWSGTAEDSLSRGLGDPANPTYYEMAKNVQELYFSFHDASMNITTNEANVSYIEISLKVKEDDNEVDLRSTVQPRNIK